MDDDRISSCSGCFIWLVLILVGAGAISFGAKVLWISLIALFFGLLLGSLLGSGIGVASGGTASDGSCLIGTGTAIVLVLVVNLGIWVSERTWPGSVPEVGLETITGPISFVQGLFSQERDAALEIVTYEEIVRQYQEPDKAEWNSYVENLIGNQIELKGLVVNKADGVVELVVDSSRPRDRIYLIELSNHLFESINDTDMISVKGRIVEIDTFLGVSIAVNNIELVEHHDR